MSTTVARLEAVLGADTGQFDRSMDRSEGRMKSMGKAAALGGLAIAGGLAVGLKKSVDAALESEKAQARLNQALDGAGVSQAKYGKEIEANIQRTSKLAALDDEDLSDAFAKLVRSTGDVTKATEGMNLAADIARARNISLEAATKAVERSLIGNGAAFSKLGVQVVKSSEHLAAAKTEIESWRDSSGKLTEAEEQKAKALMDTARTLDKQATAAKAFDEAQRRFAGGAKEYGETAAGAQERFGVAVENLQEKIGAKLLPVLAKLMETALKVIDAIEREWPKIMKVIGPVMDDVQRVVGEVTADIAAVWDRHGKTIMQVVTFVFGTIKTAIENTMRIIQGVIDTAMGLLTGDWDRAWTGIKNIVGGVFDAIGLLLSTALTVLGTAALKLGTTIKDKVVEGLSGIGNAAWNVIDNIGEWIADKVATIIGWGTGIGSKVKQAAVDALVGIGNAAWDVVNNIGTKIGEMAETVRGWGSSVGGWVKDAVPAALLGIGAAAWGIINNIWEFIHDRIEQVKGWGKSIGTWIFNAIIGALVGIGQAAWDKIKSGVDWLMDKLPGGSEGAKVTPPSSSPSPGGNTMGTVSGIWDELAVGRGMGLTLTSGLRPGDPGDHGRGHAIDMAGPASTMAAFAMAVMGRPGVKDVIYGGLNFWQDNGRRVTTWAGNEGLRADHYDHAHVSVFDKGGILRPGWTMAYNGTGQNEYVSRGGGGVVNFNFPNYLGSRQELMSALRDATAQFERRNGRSAF